MERSVIRDSAIQPGRPPPDFASAHPGLCLLYRLDDERGSSNEQNIRRKETMPLSPMTTAILALVQGLLPALTAIVGGIWIAWTYLENQKHAQAEQIAQAQKENTTRLLEARKPFIDKQLAPYVETSQVAGKLVSTEHYSDSDWQDQFRRFEELFWTELSMVEDEGVKAAMQNFARKLRWINSHQSAAHHSDQEELQQLSYQLARALRSGIESTWYINLSLPAPPNF